MSQSEVRATGPVPSRRENIFRRAPGVRRQVRTGRAIALLLASTFVLSGHVNLHAQSDKDKNNRKPSDVASVRIELTGGDDSKPVADASVYLKFVEERKLLKDRQIEFNLKTNQEGVARSPEVPKGKILIQIVAPGWKTFGEYYQLTDDEQTIQIHLVRPTTKWY